MFKHHYVNIVNTFLTYIFLNRKYRVSAGYEGKQGNIEWKTQCILLATAQSLTIQLPVDLH